MAEKTILGRIIQKHDIEANWNLATDFIPKQGEIIVYDIDENYTYERFKIGDGVTNVNDLPFASATPDWSINDPNAAGYIENRTHWVGTAEAPLTFDGDITGKEVVEMGAGEYFVKMSDIPKTVDELIGSTLIVKQKPALYNDYLGPVFELVLDENNVFQQDFGSSGSMVMAIHIYSSGSDAIFMLSIQGDVSESGLPLSEGVYFTGGASDDDWGYTHSLSCLTGPQEVAHKLDKKYLPDFVSTVNGQTPDANGNIDIDSKAIIDVTKLPTEDINENAFYKLMSISAIRNQNIDESINVYFVDELPEVGLPFKDNDKINVYYYTKYKDTLYYLDEDLSNHTGFPIGWKVFYDESLTILRIFDYKYRGIITNINNDPCDNNLRFLLTTSNELYTYNNNGWVKSVSAYENPPLIDLHWDGVIGDKEVIDGSVTNPNIPSGTISYVKISDSAFTKEQLIGSQAADNLGNNITITSSDFIETGISGYIALVNGLITIISSAEEVNSMIGQSLFTNGTYFTYYSEAEGVRYFTSLTSPSTITKIDSKYLDVTVPTKTSELTNDSGFITASDIPDADVPTKISELENDAGYLNTTTGSDGNPELRLPEMTTIASSMVLGLHGDEVSITDNGNTSSIVLDGAGGAQLNGDFHVQTPTANESIANKKYVDDSVAGLVDSAPATLNTLKELSAALGNDENFATTVANRMGNIKKQIDSVEGKIPTKVSTLTNDSGYITANDIPITTTDYSVAINGKEFLDLNSDDSMHLATQNSLNLSSINDISLNAKNIDVEGDMTVQTPKTAESVANKKYVDDSIPSKVSELTNDSGYQTAANVNTLISNAAISTSQLINGDSVDKLYLDGKFHIGSASSNKTFRLPADAITIEYSNDGGSTWTNYGNTAAQKEMLFDESQGYTWYLGKKTNKTQTTNDMLRVTISNVTDRYIGVKQVYHYASYNGQGLVFDLEYSTLSAPTTFVKVISDGRLRGWYGHNMYNFNQRTIGASNATTSAIRLTYKMNEINNSYASSSIKDIRFFGDNVWTAPADSYIGNMLKLNTPYKFTDDNTIDFPGTVDVNALKVNGTDISETYATKAEVEALVAKIEELMASI